MPPEASVLISTVGGRPDDMSYYEHYQDWVFQSVHFTTLKPWRTDSKSSNPIICGLLREFGESINGIEHYHHLIPPITNDFLIDCP